MKKKLVLTIISLFLLLILINVIIFFERPVISYNKNILLDNECFYSKTAELYYQDYIIRNLNNTFVYFNEDKFITCYTEKYKFELSDEEYDNYKIVYDSYRLDKESLNRIYVYDTFVAFCTINGRTSFVYSVNGQKPKYVNNPEDQKKRIYVEKITDNWYYLCDQS